MWYTWRMGIKKRALAALAIAIAVPLAAEYSPWTFFGGLNLIYNSDGSGVSIAPKAQEDGSPGGLSSAPSPLRGFLGLEYRYPFRDRIVLSPSVSLWSVKYLWADDRALPAEIENRTAMVPSIFLEVPFLYTFERGDFLFRAGGGLGFLIRFAFLEFGVDADEKSYEEDLSAGQQVARINRYLWSDARWVYPTLQGEMTYRLENGWGAGLTLRVGIPIFNLWATPSVPFADSLMVMVAVTITPPRATKPAPADSQ